MRKNVHLSADEICGYTVYKWRSELPFKVVLLDRHTGDAKIVLDDGARLDFELKRKYSFDVAAYDCQTGTHAPRYLHVDIVVKSKGVFVRDGISKSTKKCENYSRK